MKSFEFVAFNSSGKKKLGTIKAWSLAGAKKKMQERGFYIAQIKFHDDPVKNPFSFFKWVKELSSQMKELRFKNAC
jgi:hypothetical protein